jgi:hypothetical protein
MSASKLYVRFDIGYLFWVVLYFFNKRDVQKVVLVLDNSLNKILENEIGSVI